ncbi:MAG: OmpA family protein [Woeseiaceae bacterium]|nr:OmpA family protein [Woeseiaceae bacterium]
MKFVKLMLTTAVLAVSGTALAEAEDGQKYISLMATYTDSDNDRRAEKEVTGGQVSFGVAGEKWNTEFVLMRSELTSLRDETLTGFGVDIQRVFARESILSPYVYAGVGVLEWDPASSPSDRGMMYSLGGGLNLDLFGNTALRLDYRHRWDRATIRERAEDDMLSLGVQIAFGRKTEPYVAPVVADTDGDGVNDDADACPNTPAGMQVDSYGCQIVMDADGDGVRDADDKCPGTVRGARVDADGCELDSDSDGVVDRLDECPGTAPGKQVDVKGCEIKAEIKLPGVNFESNSDRLLPGAERVLADAAATLLMNPTIKVEVAGHTDSDGDASYNIGLSTRRALTVHDYLVRAGVDESRITVRGYGESQPIADNSTATGKAQNRRVVLRVTER